jgi:hypothetical protein
MVYIRVGEAKPDCLDSDFEFHLLETIQTSAQRSPFKRVNFLLGLIESQHPESLKDFVNQLNAKYESLIEKDCVIEQKISLEETLYKCGLLEKYPELAQNTMNYYLQSLGLSEYEGKLDSQVTVKNRHYFRSFLHPAYYYLLTLIEVLGMEAGIQLYKRHTTLYFIAEQADEEERIEEVETIFERVSARAPNRDSDWVMVAGMFKPGKYAFKNENCLWIDALEDLPDAEIKYYVCCYGDYTTIKTNNKNFILTMEHTIAQGDAYCSRVIHDPRVDWDLRHPPKEFWEGEMNPP